MKFNCMMASGSNMFPAWFIIFSLTLFHVSQASVSSQTGGRDRWYQGKGVIRSRRHLCADGTYKHNNNDCCLCGAGQRLKEHCIASQDDGECELCEPGRFSSHPNKEPTCELCRSCSHPNANLEEDEPCKPDSNAKCRCIEDHYCSSDTGETCLLCNACKVCADGIKETCTATKDTVCKDKSEGGNKSVTILSIVIPVIFVIILAIIGFMFWRKRQQRMKQHNITQQTNGNATEMLLPRRGVDPSPYLPDIAEELGWPDMEAIAMRSGMPTATVESCRLDNPGDSQRQTLQLLKIWVEQQGRNASDNLVQNLLTTGKRGKAERVADILSSVSGA